VIYPCEKFRNEFLTGIDLAGGRKLFSPAAQTLSIGKNRPKAVLAIN